MRDYLQMVGDRNDTAVSRRKQLQRFIDANNITVYRWARDAGLKSDGVIRNFLAGKSKTMTHETISKLAAAARVTVADIFPEDTAVGKVAPGREKKALGETSFGNLSLMTGKRPDLIRDLPIRGHAKAGLAGFFIDQGETWGFAMRPESLRGITEAYAVRVNDDSMLPRYESGTVLQVDPFRAPKAGDNVVVQLADGQAFVKVLKRWNRDAKTAACEQFNPRKVLELKDVQSVHLVVGVDYLER